MSTDVETITGSPSAEMLAFAQEQGVSEHLSAVLDMTRRVFPGVPIAFEVDHDPEIPNDRHIVLVVEPSDLDVDTALDALYRWHNGLFSCCSAPLAPAVPVGRG